MVDRAFTIEVDDDDDDNTHDDIISSSSSSSFSARDTLFLLFALTFNFDSLTI